MKLLTPLVTLTIMMTAPAMADDATVSTEANPVQMRADKGFDNWMFQTLRDPDTAKWRVTTPAYETEVVLGRGILGKKKWNGVFGCYMLNAKNAYGAYVGYNTVAVMVEENGTVQTWQTNHAASNDDIGGMVADGWAAKIITQYCR